MGKHPLGQAVKGPALGQRRQALNLAFHRKDCSGISADGIFANAAFAQEQEVPEDSLERANVFPAASSHKHSCSRVFIMMCVN